MVLSDSAALAEGDRRAGGLERARYDQRDIDRPSCALLVASTSGRSTVSASVRPVLRAQSGDLGAAARDPDAAVSAQLIDLGYAVVSP
jgi:hypothetical protein